MVSTAIPDGRHVFLGMAMATRRERQVAIAVVAFVLFVAVVPFARLPLAQLPVFIPSYEAALFFIDLITAALLFDQFGCLQSSGILILACGYLFDALMIAPHALSVPGVFTRTGLLGATTQNTAWLYVFWHGGFSLFVIGYAVLRRVEEKTPPSVSRRAGRLIAASAAGVALLVAALTLLATWGSDALPVVIIAASFLLTTLLVEMARLHAIAVGASASAEAQLARRRDRGDLAAPRGARTDTFIHRQNIVHYRSLLESGSFDEAQRRSIEKLLDEEETKIRSGQTGG